MVYALFKKGYGFIQQIGFWEYGLSLYKSIDDSFLESFCEYVFLSSDLRHFSSKVILVDGK